MKKHILKISSILIVVAILTTQSIVFAESINEISKDSMKNTDISKKENNNQSKDEKEADSIDVKNEDEEIEGFFTVDKTEVKPGEIVIMTIDLSKINKDNFEFILTSDTEILNNIKNEIIENNEDNITTIDNNSISIKINKQNLDIDKINLEVTIPDKIEIETIITLTAEINYSNMIIGTETTNLEIVDSVKEDNENNNEKKDNKDNNPNSEKEQNDDESKTDTKEMNNVKNSSTSKASPTLTTTSSSRTTQENSDTTYNGSRNNYLTNIEVEGYSLTPNFITTNTTYFLTVENNVTDLQINAEKSDETAKVNIYGNTDLQIGKNKILVTVTAQNGNVRTYRIYVTKKE